MTYKPLDDWEFSDLQQTLALLALAPFAEVADSGDKTAQAEYDSNEAYAEAHDHWQDGAPWMGPLGSATATPSAAVLAQIKRQFTPVDVINEVLDRCANALVKREPDVQLVALDAATAAADKQNAEHGNDPPQEVTDTLKALAAWWDRVKLWEATRQAVRRSRWSGRGSLRLWLPPAELDEVPAPNGEGTVSAIPTGLSIDDALTHLQLSSLLPDAAGIYIDPVTQERAALVLSEDQNGNLFGEIWRTVTRETDKQKVTVVRVVREDVDAALPEVYELAIGGVLPVAEMSADVLITDPVRRQQAQLNFANSIIGRVLETAGFPERYTINAAAEGVWTKTPPANADVRLTRIDASNETWYLVAVPRTLGAGVTTDLVGIELTQADGSKSMTTPSVQFKDPTDPQFAITGADNARATILQTCHQGHVIDTRISNTSADAVQEHRADFEDDLVNVQPAVEGMLRDLLTAVLRFAALMGTVGQPSILDKYRVAVTLRVDPGPLTPTEQQAIVTAQQAGVISRATALSRLGVEDVEAEIERLDADATARLTLRAKQAEVMAAFYNAGATLEVAAKLAGLDDADVKLLVEAQRDLAPPALPPGVPPGQQPPPPPNGNGGPPQQQPPQPPPPARKGAPAQ